MSQAPVSRTLGQATSVEELTPSTSIDPAMSSTATNITNLVMGLNPTTSTQPAKAEGNSPMRGWRARGAFNENFICPADQSDSPNGTRSGCPLPSSLSSMVYGHLTRDLGNAQTPSHLEDDTLNPCRRHSKPGDPSAPGRPKRLGRVAPSRNRKQLPPTSELPTAPVTKKPSKWKLSFGKASAVVQSIPRGDMNIAIMFHARCHLFVVAVPEAPKRIASVSWLG
ncbi:hypothetical protein F5887DRAFT_1075512 [Amanita rubescens]|nr:hypothetical protein F5887DRAFT_1075512 [Amanita rubescens]